MFCSMCTYQKTLVFFIYSIPNFIALTIIMKVIMIRDNGHHYSEHIFSFSYLNPMHNVFLVLESAKSKSITLLLVYKNSHVTSPLSHCRRNAAPSPSSLLISFHTRQSFYRLSFASKSCWSAQLGSMSEPL